MILDGKYRLLRLLGRGGTGRVYEAENLALRKTVAVKFVFAPTTDDSLTRLRREAQIIASLQHPNVCDLYDFGATSNVGRPYLVLERLQGETFAGVLQRKQRIGVERAVDFFAQILSGLNAAHTNKILHRDLKPQNVFVVERLGCAPLAKLVDFGLAKDMSGTYGATITRPGMICGTPQYMSPEQLCNGKLDPRSDLFAVGVMLYEALAGVHPFNGATMAEVQQNIIRSTPTPLRELDPSIPAALEQVVIRALAKLARDRFSSAPEMQQALAASLGRRQRASWSGRRSTLDDEATTARHVIRRPVEWVTHTPSPG